MLPFRSFKLASSATKPVAYVVSLGDNKLAAGEPGEPVVLSAESAVEHVRHLHSCAFPPGIDAIWPWLLVPDSSAGTGTTRYIMVSAKKTFLAKAADTDHIITSTERADALSIEILQDADRDGAYKLVSDGLVLTGNADGKVELQPDSEDKAVQWLFQLTPTEGADKAEQFIFIE